MPPDESLVASPSLSQVFTVTLEPGDALILPAYWYHQVDSYAPPDRLNVAVNYWFQGHSLATRLYRTLRENLFINCTEVARPGERHPCHTGKITGKRTR